jgi:hypothetical protein
MPRKPQPGIELEHFKLLWDYIKFHLTIYLATPAVVVVLAQSFGINNALIFKVGWCLMTICCLISAVHASRFMADRINVKWDDSYEFDWENDAINLRRRRFQHHLYWLALFFGLGSFALAWLVKLMWPAGA